MTEKKYVSDVLKKEDFQENGIYAIYAGTGSGKNTWVEKQLVEMFDKIYLTTSRKIKEMQTINDDNLFYKNGDYVIHNLSETFEMLKTGGIEIFESYNMFIIDEAHALYEDASFMSSVHNIHELVLELSEIMPVVLMTATANIFKQWFENTNIKEINLLEELTDIKPKHIYACNRITSLEAIRETLGNNEIVAIMTNTLSDIPNNYINELLKMGAKKEEIFIYANESNAKKHNIPLDKDKIEYLLKYQELPPATKVFICTSAGREGYNVNNTNIGLVLNESHGSCNIQQFYGRFRNYTKGEYVLITDARENNNRRIREFDNAITRASANALTKTLRDVECGKYPATSKKYFIKCVEDDNFLISYCIIHNRFELNKLKFWSLKIKAQENEQYSNNLFNYIRGIFNMSNITIEKPENKLKEQLKYFYENKIKISKYTHPKFWQMTQELIGGSIDSKHLMSKLNKLNLGYKVIPDPKKPYIDTESGRIRATFYITKIQ